MLPMDQLADQGPVPSEALEYNREFPLGLIKTLLGVHGRAKSESSSGRMAHASCTHWPQIWPHVDLTRPAGDCESGMQSSMDQIRWKFDQQGHIALSTWN